VSGIMRTQSPEAGARFAISTISIRRRLTGYAQGAIRHLEAGITAAHRVEIFGLELIGTPRYCVRHERDHPAGLSGHVNEFDVLSS